MVMLSLSQIRHLDITYKFLKLNVIMNSGVLKVFTDATLGVKLTGKDKKLFQCEENYINFLAEVRISLFCERKSILTRKTDFKVFNDFRLVFRYL